VARFYKLTGNSVIPISFVVPRKAGGEIFQEDIYPNAYAGRAALQADDWLKGENKSPITMSMNPAVRGDDAGSQSGLSTFTKKKTYAELEQENIELKERASELEAQLAKLTGGKDDYTEKNQDVDEEKDD